MTVRNISKERIFRSSPLGGEVVDCGLLGCDTVWSCRQLPTFRRDV